MYSYDLPKAGLLLWEDNVYEKGRKYEEDEIRKIAGSMSVYPAFCDVHVHFREPGYTYKETVRSGSTAAARGGYSAVCTMPNLNPVPDSPENLRVQTEAIDRDSVIRIYPYGAITKGEKGETLSDMEGMAEHVIAFSDDGKGVQSEEMMRNAMITAKKLGRIVAAHCEDERFQAQDKRSEWMELKRDIELAAQTGAALHVCHISCRESVELIRQAKVDGIDISCETAPHYLIFDETDVRDEGRFKMNPPIRGREDREALIEGIIDGTIDMIATDHAPHSAEEKSRGFDSLYGIVGIETAFPVLYTRLVKTGIISEERLTELMSVNPAKRFGIDMTGDFCVWDNDAEYVIDSDEFLSMGKSSPFEGMRVFGRCRALFCKGYLVYEENV